MMETQGSAVPNEAQFALMQRKMLLESKIKNGAGWFYWIAGLSLINSVIYLFGAGFTFVMGLGATQIVDGIMTALNQELGHGWDVLRIIGFVIDVVIAGFFVLLGWLGRKRYFWPMIIGMVIYAIDGIVLLLFQDYLGAGFHAWALFSVGSSLSAFKELKNLEESGMTETIKNLGQ